MCSPSFDAKCIKRVHTIVVALLFYGRALDNKVVEALNTIGTQQAASTESTNGAIEYLLDYLATPSWRKMNQSQYGMDPC